MPNLSPVPDIDSWLRFAFHNGFVAHSMLTLTFRDNRSAITPERALWEFRYLVRRLNQYLGGKNYRHKWGHSYFGYIFGVEPHKDGCFHAHAVVDNWIDFKMVHEIWNYRCGYAWTKVCDDTLQATSYVLKYLLKTSQRPSYFFQPRKRTVDPRTGSIFPADAARQGTKSRAASFAAGGLPLTSGRRAASSEEVEPV